jgi:hypothetical protein
MSTITCPSAIDCARYPCELAKLVEDDCNADVSPGGQHFATIKRCAGDIAIVSDDAHYYYYRGPVGQEALYAVLFFPDQLAGWICLAGPSSVAVFPEGCGDTKPLCAYADAGG